MNPNWWRLAQQNCATDAGQPTQSNMCQNRNQRLPTPSMNEIMNNIFLSGPHFPARLGRWHTYTQRSQKQKHVQLCITIAMQRSKPIKQPNATTASQHPLPLPSQQVFLYSGTRRIQRAKHQHAWRRCSTLMLRQNIPLNFQLS
jgi:hypothetical protein